jgi:hypothetical protein
MRRVAFASGLLLAGCASLGAVDKTPDRDTVAELLRDDLACRETPEKPCADGDQITDIALTSLRCEEAPLRSGIREAAHARCAFAGEIVRADGRRERFDDRRDFSLVDLTPGAYRPQRMWTIAPRPKAP